jgi:hypothetical protein
MSPEASIAICDGPTDLSDTLDPTVVDRLNDLP